MEAVELNPDLRSLLDDTFEFLGGVDDATELRGRLLEYLSPPAPEVDEATRIWREMRSRGQEAVFCVNTAAIFRDGTWDAKPLSLAEIAYLRTTLSELIASKDAEIAKAQLWATEQHKCADKYAAKLAAMRAENERLKGEDRVSSDDLYEWYKEGMHIRESNGINPYMAGSLAYYQSLHGWLSRDLQIALAKACPSYTLTPLPKLKAAERNTAEPATDGQTSVFPPIAQPAESWSVIDSAPIDSGMDAEAVEQAELLWAQLPVNRKWTSIPTHEKALVCHLLSTYRTEAEARGRREALDAIERLIRAERAGKEPPHDR